MNKHFGQIGILVGLAILLMVTSTSAMAHDLSSDAELPTSNLLQFQAGGHLIGFQPNRVYLVTLDHALSVEFVGGSGAMPQASNAAHDSPRAHGAPPLDTVTYRNVWDGIDVTYQAASHAVAKSTYTLAAGADVNRIQLRYNVPVELQSDGSLAFQLVSAKGSLTESSPVAWQDIDGARVPVAVRFVLSENRIGFNLGQYDARYSLTIDPTITWYSFFGTDGGDWASDVVIDASGNIYVTGTSRGSWGNPKRAYTDTEDAFVAELNGTTGALVWNTFLGGTGYDSGGGIALYGTSLYVVGDSDATWGSPLNPFTGSGQYAQDAFVAKLDTSGNLLWNTFMGGNGSDAATAVAVDSVGNVYIAGESNATWGTPIRGYSGFYAGFVAKLHSYGDLFWNTFLGGAGYSSTYAYSIAVDSGGNAFVSGYSTATWGSPVRAYTASSDVFAARLDTFGALQWNTFLGGTGSDDNLRGLALDGAGNVYVGGYSDATWGSPQQSYTSGEDGFVAKLNAANGSLSWNTFFGGAGSDDLYGLTVDGSGNTYVTGESSKTWGLPINPFVGGIGYGGSDAYIVKINSNGITQWNTFLGGTDDDWGRAVAYVGSSKIVMVGESYFGWGSPVRAYAGGDDAMIAKLNTGNGVLQWNTFLGSAGADKGVALTVDTSGSLYLTGHTGGDYWQLGNTLSIPRPWSGGQDAFVVKMNSAGIFQWLTFLGGTGDDSGNGIAVDTTGHLYVSGHSNATWGLPVDAYSAGYDTFVARLDAATGALQWNTFVGGSGTDYNTGVALDTMGNTYVVGESTATWGSPVRTFGGGSWDAFATKIDNTGTPVWNTFLGGAGSDEGAGITVEFNVLLYVVGDSTTNWGSPVRSYLGNADMFVAGLSATSGGLQWNTFLGGPGNDYGSAIAHDTGGNLYVTGDSDANWGPIPMRPYSAGTDMFVSKLNSAGTLQWNTFLGGAGMDNSRAITVDNLGHILVVGNSNASWGTPTMPYQSGGDVSITALNSNGGLWWNGFWGNQRTDFSNGVVAGANNIAYVTGSSNYLIDPYYGEPSYGGFDAFVLKLDTRGQLFLPLIAR